MAAILGILDTGPTSPTIPIASIASFAANCNAQEAYQQLCNDLYEIGVTEDVVCREENKILDALNSHGMVASSPGCLFYSRKYLHIFAQATNLPTDRISGSAKVDKPSFRLVSRINWSHSTFDIGQSGVLNRLGRPSTDSPQMGSEAQPT